MKTTHRKHGLTFGEFIAAVYETVGKRKAKQLVRLAVNTQHVRFLGPLRYLVV